MTKEQLFVKGLDLLGKFREINPGIGTPDVYVNHSRWPFSACAYYRPTYIKINLKKCAPLGTGGASWSWPGYVIDRTPYGVLAHELGHHTDCVLGGVKSRTAYSSEFSAAMRRETGEPKLTNYCPNDAEWFAEIFRLFVTNPSLLSELRPRSYKYILDAGVRPVIERGWYAVLKDAPSRTITQAEKKVREAEAWRQSQKSQLLI